jgi:hypothetical protein
VIRKPVYDPKKHGNVFDWILVATDTYREMRKVETNAAKEVAAELERMTGQKWRTKSGKPSSVTGERYLPEKAIKSLSPAEYAATTRAKRAGKAKGKQFVKQPKTLLENSGV